MKVTPNQSYTSLNSKQTVNSHYSSATKSNVAFGSGQSSALGYVKTKTASILDSIAKKGFFAEFLVIDTISMILPRIWVGLHRDKKETGKTNYKAGAEEAIREVTSGPSMFVIPLLMLECAKKLMPSAKVAKDTLPHLSNMMKELGSETSNLADFKDAAKLKSAFADKVFESVFKEHKLDNREELKQRFNNILKKGNHNKTAEELSDFISEVNNKNKNVTNEVKGSLLDTRSVTLNSIGKAKSIKANYLLSDFHNYTNGISKALAKNDVVSNTKTAFEGLLTKVENVGRNLRRGTSMLSFLAVGVFLMYLPKLYQISKISPANRSAKRVSGEESKEGVANANK